MKELVGWIGTVVLFASGVEGAIKLCFLAGRGAAVLAGMVP